jgi:hypothetical protein
MIAYLRSRIGRPRRDSIAFQVLTRIRKIYYGLCGEVITCDTLGSASAPASAPAGWTFEDISTLK